jgi:hypothetical protein
MRPYRGPLRGQGIFFAVRSSADCITNMSGFDLRQAQGDMLTGLAIAGTVILVLGLVALRTFRWPPDED